MKKSLHLLGRLLDRRRFRIHRGVAQLSVCEPAVLGALNTAGPVRACELDAVERHIDLRRHLRVEVRRGVVDLGGGGGRVLVRARRGRLLRGGGAERCDGSARLLRLEHLERRLHRAEELLRPALVRVSAQALLVPRALDHLELVLNVGAAGEGGGKVGEAERREAPLHSLAAQATRRTRAAALALRRHGSGWCAFSVKCQKSVSKKRGAPSEAPTGKCLKVGALKK